MGVSTPCHPMPGLGVGVGSLGLYPPGELGTGWGVLLHVVPPWGTGKDWLQSGLGHGQLQGGAGQRTPIAMGLRFV